MRLHHHLFQLIVRTPRYWLPGRCQRQDRVLEVLPHLTQRELMVLHRRLRVLPLNTAPRSSARLGMPPADPIPGAEQRLLRPPEAAAGMKPRPPCSIISNLFLTHRSMGGFMLPLI